MANLNISTGNPSALLNPEPEIWKDIPEWEGLYQASTFGRIKSVRRTIFAVNKKGTCFSMIFKEKVLRFCIDKTTGYKHVVLSKNAVKLNSRIHTLMADTFLPNPENKRCVNHKDGIKTNNYLSNLERCTYSENMVHAFATGLVPDRKGEQKKGL